MRALIPSMLATFAVSMGIVWLLSTPRLAPLVLDRPNERSLHDTPIPRTGGVGLMLAAAFGWWFCGVAATMLPIVMIALLLAALFLGDDIASLSVGVRFGAQFAGAIAFVAWTWPYPAWLAPLLVVGLVWSMNLYNFMDGSNGLAGGMTAIGFGALTLGALTGFHTGDAVLASTAGIVAAAAAGFLVWNYGAARIFLGDAGSVPLGFLAGALGILGWRSGTWPFWLPLLVFSVFIVDSGLTLAKRLIHRENPFQAHRSHYYQRLIRMGWSHTATALKAYTLMFASAVSAIAWQSAPASTVWVGLAAWSAILLSLAILIDRRWRASPMRTPS